MENSSPNQEFYGSRDEKQEHLLPADWSAKVVVSQVSVKNVEGEWVELPSTRQMQTYEPKFFDSLNNSEGESGKSFFSESNLRVKVLHDPRD